MVKTVISAKDTMSSTVWSSFAAVVAVDVAVAFAVAFPLGFGFGFFLCFFRNEICSCCGESETFLLLASSAKRLLKFCTLLIKNVPLLKG